MSADHRENQTLDELLKKALADDLPADVSADMRKLAGRFRAATMQDGRTAGVRAWVFRRGVWAVLAILMLLLGSLLQGRSARSPLADRISHIKAEISSPGPAGRPGATAVDRVIDPRESPVIRRKNHDRA